MSELPDPKDGWRQALLRIVVAEKAFYPHGETAAVTASFTPLLSALPLICICGGLRNDAYAVVYALAALWLAAVYLCYWRLYTRPRMPTIWEALAGYVLVLLMPLISGTRLLMRWVREASAEASEADRKAGE